MFQILHFFRHLDESLLVWANTMGPWTYVILFAIIFVETGVVIMPFLPGDTLLFVCGAVCASLASTAAEKGTTAPLQVIPLTLLLIVAAVLGDAVNYTIGHRVGPAIFSRETGWLLNKKHLVKTKEFYERYGGKTIIMARFVPFVRTFAPFVAGIGRMNYWKFAAYNVSGAVLWVVVAVAAGWYFGGLPVVKKNFELVIVAIVVLSALPGVIGYLRERGAKPKSAEAV